MRAVSAPNRAMMSRGSTTLFFDFDIFSMPPSSTGWPSSRAVAPTGLAAARTGHVEKGMALVQRIARAVGNQVFRQQHRQIALGHRHVAARWAMDDRNRRAPVALAADAPVAQAPGRLLAAERLV